MRSVSNSYVIERMTTELRTLQPLLSDLVKIKNFLAGDYDEKQYAKIVAYLSTISEKSNEVIARWSKYAADYKTYSLEEDERRIKLEGQVEALSNTLIVKDKRIEELLKEAEVNKAVAEARQAQILKLKDVRDYAKQTSSQNQTLQNNIKKIGETLMEIKNTEGDTETLGKLDKIIEMLEKMQSMEGTATEIRALSDEVHKTLEMIDSNKELIINRRVGTGKGTGSIRYNHDLDSEKLIAEYKAAGNRITKEMRNRYKAMGMTYQGVRARLIREGVWNPAPRVKQED